MCRILSYAGPEIGLGAVVAEPEHSLVVQSYAPRQMTSGVVNADGFGFAWYDPARQADPFVYRSILPIWNDSNLATLAGYVRSTSLLAYVRSATPGQGLDISNTQPFVSGRWSFVHNGVADGFTTAEGRRLWRGLRSRLDDDADALIRGGTDSEYLFAWLIHHIDDTDPTAAVRRALALLAEALPGVAMRMNFVLGDGRRQIAVRHAVGAEAPSLYLLRDHSRFAGARLVASEPLFDDPAWQPLPADTLLSIDDDPADGHRIHPIAA
jgi:ergothioneine biosynthesis protein EgtC